MADSDLVQDMAWRVDAFHQMSATVGGRWANDPVLSQAKGVQTISAIRTDVASILVNSQAILTRVTAIQDNEAALLSAMATIKAGIAQILTILQP